MSTTPVIPPPLRIASLLPAATEMVCALGLEGQLVGVSHECDFPASVRRLPVLTKSKLIERASSRATDLEVRDVLRRALAIYDIDVEALRAVAPDVILTQDLCDVCAVPFEEVQRAANQVCPGAKLVTLSPTRLEDVWNNVRLVGETLGVPERAKLLVDRLGARLGAIRQRAYRLARHPRILSIEWLDPVMIAGTWMPELIELVGGRPLVTKTGEAAKTLSQEELRTLKPKPDVVVIKPCGFDIARSVMELGVMRSMLAELEWPAFAGGDVYLADGNAFFNRPGPRLVESAEILAAMAHPFDFKDLGALHAKSFTRVALR